MNQFDHILNWTLKAGSHSFPGPDGGTCINEAALVAAGFEYRPVRRVQDMPKCFSRPICRLAMILNDEANDEQRQRLLPFITRLACADEMGVEHQRQAYIAARIGWHPVDFDEGLRVLDGALAIGRQAELAEGAQVVARMAAARDRPAGDGGSTEKPLLMKLKEWLRVKQTEGV